MADPRDVVMVGGGGHAAVLYDALRLSKAWNVVGYLAPQEGLLSTMGVRWLGDDALRSTLHATGVNRAVLGVGGLRTNAKRAELFAAWSAAGFTFIDVVHPRAILASHVTHGTGLQILAGAVINTCTRLGANVIVNTNATIEHECEIGDHAHIAPAATLCGGVAVGEGALVGAGAVAIPGVRIGRFSLVGAGSAVTRDVAAETVVMGCPASAVALVNGPQS